MTKSLRSPSPQRVAVLGAMALLLATDQATAKPHSCRVTNFDADKDFTGKSDVTDGACALAAAYTMTALQHQVDTAGAAPAARHAKKARTLNFNGQGSSAKKATCIGIDGYGMASAPAAKTAITIGSGEALGATDEAGVIDFGASYGQGKAPMALVAAAAKKASGSARRRAGSHYVVDRGSLGGELIEILATGLELGPAWFSLWSGAADSPSATPLHLSYKNISRIPKLHPLSVLGVYARPNPYEIKLHRLRAAFLCKKIFTNMKIFRLYLMKIGMIEST